MSSVVARLAELGLVLPSAPKPLAAYVPAVRSGDLVFTAGQLPLRDGKLIATGLVGARVDPSVAKECAAQAALNALAAIATVVNLEQVTAIVKVTGFVAGVDGFTDQPAVINGASELLGALWPAGHARSALGVSSLPIDAPVEIELIAEVRG